MEDARRFALSLGLPQAPARAVKVTTSIPMAEHALLLIIAYQPMGVVSRYAHRLGLLLARVHAILDTHHRVPLALLSTTVHRLMVDVRWYAYTLDLVRLHALAILDTISILTASCVSRLTTAPRITAVVRKYAHTLALVRVRARAIAGTH